MYTYIWHTFEKQVKRHTLLSLSALSNHRGLYPKTVSQDEGLSLLRYFSGYFVTVTKKVNTGKTQFSHPRTRKQSQEAERFDIHNDQPQKEQKVGQSVL